MNLAEDQCSFLLSFNLAATHRLLNKTGRSREVAVQVAAGTLFMKTTNQTRCRSIMLPVGCFVILPGLMFFVCVCSCNLYPNVRRHQNARETVMRITN